MILQALARYYEILAEDPESGIVPYGYSQANISFAVLLTENGSMKEIIPLFQVETRGKKQIEVPKRMVVPERVIRTVQVSANFLCDSSPYVFGISDKDEKKPEYAIDRFNAFCELHHQLLDGVDCVEAQALLAFLNRFDPKSARSHPLIVERLDGLLAGGNLVFMLEGRAGFLHEVPELRRAWEAYRTGKASSATGQCLVTGEMAPIARLHNNLKGVKNAQPSGASLVGFNARAYESYNRTDGQGLNAPTSEKAAFEYTAALNRLLSKESENPKFYVGDATVVYWAESPNRAYSEVFSTLFDPDWANTEEQAARRDPRANQRLREIAEKIKSGAPLDTSGLLQGLEPDTKFYVLGLSPNAARVAVRFFYHDPFDRIVQRIMAHYDDLQIEREFEDQPARITIRQMVTETVSKKASKQEAAPLLAGAVLRAMLTGAPYPAALFYAIINRVRADVDDKGKGIRKINYTRAAAIKAYLLRKYRSQPQSPIQEVLCMSLNEQSTQPAYLLGRLFAVLEKAQQDAIGDVNASIKDRYFTSACANPASAFPVLLRLSQHHIAKEDKYKNDRRIEQILNLLDVEANPIPARLTLDEQGVFILGYYHQRADFYRPKKQTTEETTLSQVNS